MHKRILIVEDEASIRDMVAFALRKAGMDAAHAADARAAQMAISERVPDLILLDWMLPGQSGLQLARQWRKDPRTKSVPILMLTARGDEPDKVAGLDAGADDYITKPFSTQEMLARIRAVLRRRAPEAVAERVEIGELVLDTATHRVTWQGAPLKVGPTEFKLLGYLMQHAERVHSRAQLLDKVWGDHVYIEERTVDVHVKRLRESLGAAAPMVETVRGAGYRLTAQATVCTAQRAALAADNRLPCLFASPLSSRLRRSRRASPSGSSAGPSWAGARGSARSPGWCSTPGAPTAC